MSEFTAFVQRPEKVDAFQFSGPHQVEQVLDAFGADRDHFTLAKEGVGKYRLTFQDPKVTEAPACPQYVLGANSVWYFATDNHNSYIVTGSWVVKRYTDTDHPEVTVMDDKSFRQKYQASIEAG